MSFSILGTGSALGKRTIKNEELTHFLDTSDEWIRTRTGIEERHVLDGETMTDLALQAGRNALENAGVAAGQLDYIICCTLGGEYITPALGSLVQVGLGAACPAFDMNVGCSGFIYGLDVVSGLFAGGRARHVLLIATDGLSRVADWTDRSTCVLFGDGAGAVVLGAGDDLAYIHTESHGWADPLYIPFPRGNFGGVEHAPVSYLYMDGQEVYKFAVNAIATGVNTAMEKTGLAPDDVHHVLLHQANLRIIEAAKKKLPVDPQRYPVNIQRTGNMSAATIPVLMDECNRAGRFTPGDNLILCAFGAGLTSGTAVLRWHGTGGK